MTATGEHKGDCVNFGVLVADKARELMPQKLAATALNGETGMVATLDPSNLQNRNALKMPVIRKVKSTPDLDTFEKYRDTPPISMAYFCKSMPPSWQKVVYTPPICITIRLPFVSRYFCKSIRVGGRWNTPKCKSPKTAKQVKKKSRNVPERF